MDFTRIQRTACPVCTAESLTTLAPVQDHHACGVWFEVGQCDACTFVFLSNPPIASDLLQFYDNPSGALMHTTPSAIVRKARNVSMRGEVSRPLNSYPPGRGSRTSVPVTARSSRSCGGWGSTPVAVDIFPAEGWKRSGIPYLQYDPVEILANTKDVYAVTMRHVLKHMPEPVDMLSTFAKQGVEVVSVVVPNIESRLAKGRAPCGSTRTRPDT